MSQSASPLSGPVTLAIRGQIGIITIKNPPVNALSPGVPEGIARCVEEAQADPQIRAIIITGDGKPFVGGADITQFAKLDAQTAPDLVAGLNAAFNTVEGCSKLVIAAINGDALGGGLELAMACHYRVAASTAKLGQPEVNLGVIPGGGGTQRLPRLVGVFKAIEMCAQGQPISAEEGLKLGLVDAVIGLDRFLDQAIEFAEKRAASGHPMRRTSRQNDELGTPGSNAPIFQVARQMAAKQAKGMLAPFKAIDAIEAAVTLPFDQGCKREAELFVECVTSPQSRALVHIFFAEREVGKVPGMPKDLADIKIEKAGILGAGTMGGGIAMVYANAGIPVLITDTTQELLDKCLARIHKEYEGRVKKGKLTDDERNKRLALITPVLDYAGFETADIVTEAVFEDMPAKLGVFARLDQVCQPGCILASNTSTLNIDEIAAATSRPDSVIGHHYFAPANVMKLLEIVRGKATSDVVIAASMKLAKRLKKVGVLVGNCFGFAGNRMLNGYLEAALGFAHEGTLSQDVDAALEGFGMAMGPFKMMDLSGVDVVDKVQKAAVELGIPGITRSSIIQELVTAGRLGQKTKAGFYRYDDKGKPQIDQEVCKLIASRGDKLPAGPQEIVDTCIGALVEAGRKILDEGIAQRSGDLDIIYLYGYGFPSWRGGPMWHYQSVVDSIKDSTNQFIGEQAALQRLESSL